MARCTVWVIAAFLVAGLQLAPLTGLGDGEGYVGKRFERVSFAGASFQACDMSRASFRDCPLGGWRVENGSGSATSWERVGLPGASLNDVALTGVKWYRGRLSGRLESVELPGLQLYRCSGREVGIEYGTLEGLSVESLTARNLQMRSVDARGARFEAVSAQDSRWRNADLRSAQMYDVDLQSARLDRCDLRNARLENCEIRGLKINGYDIEELIRKAGR